MEAITTALSKELGPRQVRVNSLAPGGILTEGTQGSQSTSIFREMKERTPLGRLGQPDDIAKIALFLASDDAYWINGQHIIAAGGMTM
jgi:3-oxoacyl-[acyl-carrier protein] reductase